MYMLCRPIAAESELRGWDMCDSYELRGCDTTSPIQSQDWIGEIVLA